MSRSPLSLAALATVAVPGLEVTAARAATSTMDFDVAEVTDSAQRTWLVKSPRTSISGAAMEGEVALLENLAAEVDGGTLGFEVPRPHGFATLPEGGRAAVFPQIPGLPLNAARLSAIVGEVAGAIAAIHALPIHVLADTGLPVYSAAEHRQRLATELETATATGHLPEALTRRWGEALSAGTLWEFAPTLVHGDLGSAHILVHEAQVSGVIEWSSAHVGDPAADLAPLLAEAPTRAVDALIDHYTQARGAHDAHLLARAILASEFALLRWLMHGVRSRDNDIIDDAVAMLVDLAVAVQGAEPIARIGAGPEPAAEAGGGESGQEGFAGGGAGPGGGEHVEPGNVAQEPSADVDPADRDAGGASDPVRSAAAPGSGAIPLGDPGDGHLDSDDDRPTVEFRRGDLPRPG